MCGSGTRNHGFSILVCDSLRGSTIPLVFYFCFLSFGKPRLGPGFFADPTHTLSLSNEWLALYYDSGGRGKTLKTKIVGGHMDGLDTRVQEIFCAPELLLELILLGLRTATRNAS